jgi:hypothetical protein
MAEPAGASANEPIFKWETLTEVGKETFRFRTEESPETICEVELTSGPRVHVWRAEDGKQHFCHGLTFGGLEAPGGAVSPYGNEVPVILRGNYELVPEDQAKPGDVLVWRGIDANEVTHSAVLIDVVVATGKKYFEYATRLRSKNGRKPATDLSLGEVIDEYGESYNTYRRKSPEQP